MHLDIACSFSISISATRGVCIARMDDGRDRKGEAAGRLSYRSGDTEIGYGSRKYTIPTAVDIPIGGVGSRMSCWRQSKKFRHDQS